MARFLDLAGAPRYGGGPVIDALRRLLLPVLVPVLVLPAAIASGAAPEVKEYEVTGTSRGRDGRPAAEKPAENDALRNAVEKGIAELAGAKALEEKAAQLKRILARSRRFIPEFRVVDRSEAGATVILKVRAKVNLTLLEADLVSAGVLEPKEKPAVLTRVMVLPAPDESGAPPWWAEGGAANAPDPLTYVIVDALRAKGFEVVEPRRPPPDPDTIGTPPPGPEPKMTDANLLEVGRKAGVDVVVRVPWKIDVAEHSLEGISYALGRATVGPVEALATKGGGTVATVTGEGVAGEPLTASQAALGKVPPEISERVSAEAVRRAAARSAALLAAALGDPGAKGSANASVKLVVAGLDTWVVYDRFERVLQRDLRSVRTATLHSIERGEATFELSLQHGVSSEKFADELTKKEFEQFSVKVTEKSPERVVVHLVR